MRQKDTQRLLQMVETTARVPKLAQDVYKGAWRGCRVCKITSKGCMHC